MSTHVMWTDETKPSGVDEIEIVDDFTVIVDGRARIDNARVFNRQDGGITYTLTIKVDPPADGGDT